MCTCKAVCLHTTTCCSSPAASTSPTPPRLLFQTLLQVLASIDGTPMLEPPAPGKLLPLAASAPTTGGVSQGLKLPPGMMQGGPQSQAQVDQEVKESMQSHFD